MKVEIKRVHNYMESNEVRETLAWEGTKEEIFKRFDKENNRLRYCNGSHYKFQDNTLLIKYYPSKEQIKKNNWLIVCY